jgi:hypothetical protein
MLECNLDWPVNSGVEKNLLVDNEQVVLWVRGIFTFYV